MAGIYTWVRNIACYLCIFNVILYIIPGNGFKRYVRFVGGILLILLVMAPLTDAVKLSGSFDEAFRLESLKTELKDVQIAREGLADLGEQKVDLAFEAEIRRQLEELIKAHDYYPVKTEVEFQKEGENIVGIDRVQMVISKKQTNIDIHVEEIQREEKKESLDVENIKKDIQDVYQIPVEHINMSVRE